MASPTQWTWVWVNSRSWWWTGRPGVLQSMGSQRVGHDWATKLNWTDPGISQDKASVWFYHCRSHWKSGFSLWEEGDTLDQRTSKNPVVLIFLLSCIHVFVHVHTHRESTKDKYSPSVIRDGRPSQQWECARPPDCGTQRRHLPPHLGIISRASPQSGGRVRSHCHDPKYRWSARAHRLLDEACGPAGPEDVRGTHSAGLRERKGHSDTAWWAGPAAPPEGKRGRREVIQIQPIPTRLAVSAPWVNYSTSPEDAKAYLSHGDEAKKTRFPTVFPKDRATPWAGGPGAQVPCVQDGRWGHCWDRLEARDPG